MSNQVPTTASVTEDHRTAFSLEPGEIGLMFTKVYSESHTERDVIRLTRAELVETYYEIAEYLGMDY